MRKQGAVSVSKPEWSTTRGIGLSTEAHGGLDELVCCGRTGRGAGRIVGEENYGDRGAHLWNELGHNRDYL